MPVQQAGGVTGTQNDLQSKAGFTRQNGRHTAPRPVLRRRPRAAATCTMQTTGSFSPCALYAAPWTPGSSTLLQAFTSSMMTVCQVRSDDRIRNDVAAVERSPQMGSRMDMVRLAFPASRPFGPVCQHKLRHRPGAKMCARQTKRRARILHLGRP
jgi:hypothetical protein